MDADAPPVNVAYRNRRSDIPDHYLFFVTFLAGSAGIVILKQLGVGQFVVTAFPVVTMLLYTGYVYVTRRYQLREDRAGDNLYYLGFLYTLTSLAYSLWLFADHEGGTEQIIQNFGVALATTIVGLALRVLFNQMRQDPVEIEREARRDLADAVASLKSELDSCVVDLNSFRRATTQSISEGMDQVAGKANQSLEHNVGRFAEVASTVLGRIDEAFSEFSNHSKKLNNVSKQTARAMEELVERIAKLEAPPDLLTGKLAIITAKFSESAELLANRSHAEAELESRLVEMSGSVERTAITVGEQLAAISTHTVHNTQTLAGEIERTSNAVNEMRGAAAEVAGLLRTVVQTNQSIFASLAKDVVDDLGAVQAGRKKIEIEVEASRRLVAEVHQALASMSQLIVQKLDGR